jgi:hypothetical protein
VNFLPHLTSNQEAYWLDMPLVVLIYSYTTLRKFKSGQNEEFCIYVYKLELRLFLKVLLSFCVRLSYEIIIHNCVLQSFSK